MKFCSNCGSKLKEGQDVCLKCGKNLNNNSDNEKKTAKKLASIVSLILFIIGFSCLVYIIINIIQYTNKDKADENIDYSEYIKLDPQKLHSDYIANEIAAEDEYEGKYYYFTGKVYKVEESWGDTYLKIQYKDQSSKTDKLIELDADFNDREILKSIKKDDIVTVYCKFNGRVIEDFMGVITTYSFKKCKFK